MRATPRRTTARPRCRDGAVAIAAITSCTNTSDPRLMIAAGLLARKARAPRSEAARLGQDLARAGIADGGALSAPRRAAGRSRGARLRHRRLWLHHLHRQFRAARRRSMAEAVDGARYLPVAVLSGNRNFPGPRASRRSRPASSLRRRWSSPMRSPAMSIATSSRTRSARRRTARAIRLADLWPSGAEIDAALALALRPADFDAAYRRRRGERRCGSTRCAGDAAVSLGRGLDLLRRPPFATVDARTRARRIRRASAARARRRHHHRSYLARRRDPAGSDAGRLSGRARRRPRTTSTSSRRGAAIGR